MVGEKQKKTGQKALFFAGPEGSPPPSPLVREPLLSHSLIFFRVGCRAAPRRPSARYISARLRCRAALRRYPALGLPRCSSSSVIRLIAVARPNRTIRRSPSFRHHYHFHHSHCGLVCLWLCSMQGRGEVCSGEVSDCRVVDAAETSLVETPVAATAAFCSSPAGQGERSYKVWVVASCSRVLFVAIACSVRACCLT